MYVNIFRYLGNANLSKEETISGSQKDCFRHVRPGLHKSILSNMRKLSFRSTDTFSEAKNTQKSTEPGTGLGFDEADPVEQNKMMKMMQIGGSTQHHFTRNGHLVANKQLIYNIDKHEGVQSVST